MAPSDQVCSRILRTQSSQDPLIFGIGDGSRSFLPRCGTQSFHAERRGLPESEHGFEAAAVFEHFEEFDHDDDVDEYYHLLGSGMSQRHASDL